MISIRAYKHILRDLRGLPLQFISKYFTIVKFFKIFQIKNILLCSIIIQHDLLL